MFCRGADGKLIRILVAFLPPDEKTSFSPFFIETLTLQLNPCDISAVGEVSAWQYSTETAPVSLTPQANWDGSNLTVTLNHTVTDAFLLLPH